MVKDVAFSSDDRYVAAAGAPNSVMVWETQSGRRVHHFEDIYSAQAIAFTAEGRRLVCAKGFRSLGKKDDNIRAETVTEAPSDQIVVFDLATGEQMATFAGHVGGTWDMAVSPDGRHVLTGGVDQLLRLWRLPD
jgi:WD40 repeat protein